MELHKISSVGQLKLQHEMQLQQASKSTEFSTILQESMEKRDVQFSKHALTRMEESGLDYNETLQQDLNSAIEKARLKGAKDIVVIGRDNVFIVNVPNNVVVTTVDQARMKEHIFTNIDSAIIL